ncbi:hypothetical protein KC640_00555, partial [Candidatus Dojkabacteria bacterium]|nr:hypothetical protein [Candidatus Dojkabacteria bacterium]
MPHKKAKKVDRKDEFASLAKQFARGKHGPSAEFSLQLEQRFLRKSGAQRRSFPGSLASLLRPRIALSGVLALALIGAVFVYVRYGSYFEVKYATQGQVAVIAGAEQQQVLAKVYSQNPQLQNKFRSAVKLPAPDATSVPQPSQPAAADSSEISLEVSPYNPSVVNYVISSLQVLTGPISLDCADFHQRPAGTVATTQFIEAVGYQYYKQEVRNSDGEISAYELFTPDQHLLWLGGDQIYSLEIAEPVEQVLEDTSTENVADEQVHLQAEESDATGNVTTTLEVVEADDASEDQVFGVDAEVALLADDEGNRYYEISWPENLTCGEQDLQLINVAKVDSETYDIFAQERYLAEVTDDTLIESVSIESTQQFTDLAKVWDQYQYDYDWP